MILADTITTTHDVRPGAPSLSQLCASVRDAAGPAGFTIRHSAGIATLGRQVFATIEYGRGFLVSVASFNLRAEFLDSGTVVAAIAAWRTALNAWGDRLCIGVYRFDDGKRCSIDLNLHVLDRGFAERMGRELDQESVWDCAAKRSIATGGKGAARSLADAIAILQSNLGGSTAPLIPASRGPAAPPSWSEKGAAA